MPPEPAATPPDNLSDREIECLRFLAGQMIPPSAEYGLPGADDPAIIADMVQSLDRDRTELKRVIGLVQTSLAELGAAPSSAEQATCLAQVRPLDSAGFAVVEAVVSRAYYRDDRVLEAIGMDPRPPFPKGYAVADGDWSLLDPVRARGTIYRDAGT